MKIRDYCTFDAEERQKLKHIAEQISNLRVKLLEEAFKNDYKKLLFGDVFLIKTDYEVSLEALKQMGITIKEGENENN